MLKESLRPRLDDLGVVWRVVLPYTKTGVVGGIMLAWAARSRDDAVTFVIGNTNQLDSLSLFEAANSITSALANEFAEAGERPPPGVADLSDWCSSSSRSSSRLFAPAADAGFASAAKEPHMSAAGRSQGARSPWGGRREAPQGGSHERDGHPRCAPARARTAAASG